MTSNQHSSDHVTHKGPNSEIGKWYPIAFFSQKIISTETYYETYNHKLLAIIEVFKTWHHYLKSCKYKVFIFTDHNNIRQFMNI